MLDKIMDLIKNEATQVVMNNSQVPKDKKQQTVDATTEAMSNGIKQNLNTTNLSGLAGLFGGQNNTSSSTNPIVDSIKNMVSNAIAQKAGLSPAIASTLAATIVPSVISAFTSKMKDPDNKEFSLESLAGMFSGNQGTGTTGKEDLMSTVGRLFG